MLSICIPVYNRPMHQPVQALVRQAAELTQAVEIRLYDDGSRQDFRQQNRPLGEWPGVVYHELPQNVGRSAIRNRLAADAAYPSLLFLDGDVLPADEGFLARYQPYLGLWGVVCGGRSYPAVPAAPSQSLHWRAGWAREVSTAAQRERQPYRSFMTNNFMIAREVFTLLRFNEYLVGYGHEDTHFGWGLQQLGVPLKHIDNPALHVGLEDAEVYLAKIRESVANLQRLDRDPQLGGAWLQAVRLLRFRQQLHKAPGAWPLLRRLAPRLLPGIYRRLLQPGAPLRLLDLYKLLLLAQPGPETQPS